MGTNPHANQVIDGIVTALAAISAGQTVGNGHVYNYTPKQVMRVPHFDRISGLLGATTGGPYYFVRDDGERIPDPAIASFGEDGWAMDVPVIVAKRDERAGYDPFQGVESPGVVQQKMLADAEACLTSSEKRGLPAIYETSVQRVDANFHDLVKSWVIGEIFFQASYVRPKGAP